MTRPDPQLDEFLQRLGEAQAKLDAGFAHLPPSPTPALGEDAAAILAEAAERMHDNDPYFHPLYAGQMLKPPHPIARAAYAMAMSINPNNHALDGGRASSAMEFEAVDALAKMFGWPQHLGHLTSSGTFANLEALRVAGQLPPTHAIAAISSWSPASAGCRPGRCPSIAAHPVSPTAPAASPKYPKYFPVLPNPA